MKCSDKLDADCVFVGVIRGAGVLVLVTAFDELVAVGAKTCCGLNRLRVAGGVCGRETGSHGEIPARAQTCRNSP